MALQKPFTGLNEFLGLYTQGQLNFDLLDQVVMSVDASVFIEPPRVVLGNGVNLNGAPPNIRLDPIIVPEGETWWVHTMGGTTDGVLNGGLDITPAIIFNGGNKMMCFQRPSLSSYGVGQLIGAGHQFVRPLIAPPESILGWHVRTNNGVAGSPNFFTSLQIQKVGI